jgi:isoquinoline 1-oxidoreductase beta subunit
MKGVVDIFEVEPVKPAHSCGGVAVVAESTYIAMEARKGLQIEWDYGPAITESSETLRKQFRRIVDSPMKVVLDQGNAEDAISKAPENKKIECDYELPFQAHATMEPMNCTVHVTADGAEAWAPTQGPEQVQSVIAQVTGLPREKIQVHTTYSAWRSPCNWCGRAKMT